MEKSRAFIVQYISRFLSDTTTYPGTYGSSWRTN